MLARVWLSRWVGPPYILFYPTVVLVALLAGLGPGLLATALSAFFAGMWILPPERHFLAPSIRDDVGLGLFAAMGVFLSVVAHLYRAARFRLVAADEEHARDERLRESEQRLRIITETIPDPVFLKDRECRLLFANPATLRVMGKPAAQVLGRTDHEIYDDPEVGAAILATDRRIMESGISQVVEERVLTPSGYRVFLSTKAPYRDLDGRILGLLGIARDITDRKIAEDALRRSEAILAQAGQMARLGAWWIEFNAGDLDSGTLHWSDEVFRIFGYPPGAVEVSNALFFERVHPHDRPRVRVAVERALTTREPYVIEHRIVRPDASEGVVLEHAEFTYDDAGKPTRLSGAVQDVTEAKEAEAKLRSAMQRLDSLLENSPLAVIEWSSADYRITRWSDEATKVFGWDAAETVGRKLDELDWIHPEDWPLVREVMSDMLTGKRPRNVNKNRNVRKDGRVIDCEWYNSTFTDADGKLAILSLVLDATDRKKGEAALREADRRKDEFLGVLSHELRNPLAPIRNALYILDRAPPEGEQAARARAVMSRQVDHLARLVDDLLDVTRITRGKVTLQRSRFDLRELVARTVEDHRQTLMDRQLEVVVRSSTEPLPIDGDATRISQIVGNLLQNSAKFTDPGGSVVISAEREEGRAAIRVQDTGIGISAEMLGRMFEPFTQADESLHRARGGLGLGLALVRGLVELHGGSVEARSAGLGRGTEVIVRIPLASVPNDAERAITPAPAAPPPRRILVVEDNVDAAATLREMLEMWGHSVDVAHAGRQGVERACAIRPDIVLCDVGLPEMDGYAVARAIRSEPALASTVLVAVTGYALPEDQRRAADAGFQFHVAKPVTIEQLEDVLARAAP